MSESVHVLRLRAQLREALRLQESAQRNLNGWGQDSDDSMGDRRDYKDDLADARREVDRLHEALEQEIANPTPVLPRAEKFQPPDPPGFPRALVDVEFDFLEDYTLQEVDTALAYVAKISAIKHLTREVEMIQALIDVIADKLGGKALPVLWGFEAESIIRWRVGKPRYHADLLQRGRGWWITIQCAGWQLCFGNDTPGTKPHAWYFCEEGKEAVLLSTPERYTHVPGDPRDDLARIYDVQTKYLSRGILWRMCVFAYELQVDTREPFYAEGARAWANEWFEKRKRGTAPAAFSLYAPVINKTVTTTTLSVDRGFWEIQKEEKKDKRPSSPKKPRQE